MMKAIFWITFVWTLNTCGQERGIQILTSAPPVEASEYFCDEMVHTINSLRALGKEKAVAAMKSYVILPDARGTHRILLICRLLFLNTNGWDEFSLGSPLPDVDPQGARAFPLFPIAMSAGFPFLVVEGYRAGAGQNLVRAVELCEKLPIIDKDLPRGDYRAAAQSLTQSEKWRKLYKTQSEAEQMKAFINNQAGSAFLIRPKREPD